MGALWLSSCMAKRIPKKKQHSRKRPVVRTRLSSVPQKVVKTEPKKGGKKALFFIVSLYFFLMGGVLYDHIEYFGRRASSQIKREDLRLKKQQEDHFFNEANQSEAFGDRLYKEFVYDMKRKRHLLPQAKRYYQEALNYLPENQKARQTRRLKRKIKKIEGFLIKIPEDEREDFQWVDLSVNKTTSSGNINISSSPGLMQEHTKIEKSTAEGGIR